MATVQPEQSESTAAVSPAEFAELVGLSLPTVRRYLQAGRIPFAQPAGRRGRVLIPLSALTALTGQRSLADTAADTVESAEVTEAVEAADQPHRSQRSGPTPRWMKRRQQSHSQ